AVVENAERGTHRGLPVIPRIPRETYPRLDVGRVVVVKQPPGSRTGELENHRERSGVRVQIRKVAVFLVRHTIELIAHAQVEREVAAQLPTVLAVKAIFVLDVSLAI